MNLMNIRDVIEEHARSVAAIKKVVINRHGKSSQGGPTAYLEIDA